MRSRRSFLSQVLGSVVASAFTGKFENVALGCQTNAWPIDPGNVETFFAVLDKVRAYGFQGFETGFANLRSEFNHPAEARRRIENTALQFFGIHIFLPRYDEQTHIAPASLYESVARGGASLGAQRLILSGAPASNESGIIPDAVAKKAEALNRAGRFAKTVGLRLAYHNHGPEFANGAAEITALLRQTDEALVSFLIDAGHAYHAGADVPGFFRAHHERIAGIHLRDFRGDEQVPLGAGGFPLKELATVIEEVRWAGWLLCEEERLTSKPGDAAMRPARDTLFRVFREKL
jgi:sugar phosphate isomerase/epimerase